MYPKDLLYSSYDRTCISNKVNEAIKKLFAKTISVLRIPPTYAALEQHVKELSFKVAMFVVKLFSLSPHTPFPKQLEMDEKLALVTNEQF